MADADTFARNYLFVDIHEPAGSRAVADLLDAAAAALRDHGEVNVQHVAFDVTESTSGVTTSLTIYYDRVERRRHARTENDGGRTGPRPGSILRPVD